MPKATRPIRIEGDIAFIPLTQGYEAVIDASDVALVSDGDWFACVRRRPDGSVQSVYAYRLEYVGEKRVNRALHQRILPVETGYVPDHRDGNGLNCRRANLRPATFSQNCQNSRKPANNRSGVKGVSWFERDRKWQAVIKFRGRQRHLGFFRCVTAAAIAYAKASRELHGEFGRVA